MKRLLEGVALWLLLPCAAALAQQPGGSIVLPEIDVIGTTPLPGSEVDRAKVPVNSSVLTREDVSRSGPPNALRSLEERVGGVTLNNAQNNPFQPNLVYRGFEASPLGGNAQGLAVYLNGARFNQPFGDTVNWDLIPDVAIDRITLEGSNAAFGLNALGGSLLVYLKNGFTWQGTEVQAYGGSFGRVGTSFQHGQQVGNVGFYFAASGLSEDGWRDFSPSRVRNYYGDLGWRGEKGEVHLNYIGAHNNLTGNGTTPVELLAVDRAAVFTYPDNTINDFGRVGLNGVFDYNEALSFQTNAYFGRFRHRTKNGDAADVEVCDDEPDFVCVEDGPNLIDTKGAPIPNFVRNSDFLKLGAFEERFEEGGPYAALNRTNTDSLGYGGTLQATHRGLIFDRPNRLVMGVSYDGGDTDFTASSELGELTLNRGFAGPGTVFLTPDGVIQPVGVRARNAYTGVYFTNILDVTDRLSVTAAGRFNDARIKLRDQIGTDLNGDHHYTRFNPAFGAAFAVTPSVSLYGGYSEANRAPTPAELSCADPESPCALTNFFVGDPPLEQVVTRTYEAGVRGRHEPNPGAIVRWKAGVFTATNYDDIQFVASGIVGRAFFQNVGKTRRQGVEAGISLQTETVDAFVEYALTDATFQSPLTLNSPANPLATFIEEEGEEGEEGEGGQIFVTPGDRLPSIARHLFKAGVAWRPTEAWKIGMTGRVSSGKFLVGDESNLNRKTRPYAVFNLFTSYQVTRNIQVFGLVENLFNTKYETFGTFSPVDEVPIVEVPFASNNRSLSAGPPIAAFAGVKVTFDAFGGAALPIVRRN